MFYTINLSPITRYQVRFYADKYFESLPIVSTAFKGSTIVKLFIQESADKVGRNATHHLCIFIQ